MKSCLLYLVRHGQSEANLADVCGGHLNSPLTQLGVAQAQETRDKLALIRFDTVYSSDMQRAIKTAEIIAGKPVSQEHMLPDLRERDFGKLEGQPDDEWRTLARQFDKKYGSLALEQRWQHSYRDDIESNGTLSRRVIKALTKIAKQNMGKTVLVGMHGGPIRTTLVKLGYAEEAALPPGSFSNSAYVVLSYDGAKFSVEKVTGIKVTN